MNATANLEACRAARIPRGGLVALAALRRSADVHVTEFGDEAWIDWPGEMPSLVNALLAIEGARLYRKAKLGWIAIDRSLPDFAVPEMQESLALDRAIVPASFDAVAVPIFQGKRIPITLKANASPRPTSALRCHPNALQEWCDRATAAEIEAVSAACCGSSVWLRGGLPALPNVERFWGERVLVPVGYRPEPDWPEAALRQAAIVDDDEILVLTPDGPEAIAVGAFRALSRASVRRLLHKSA